MKMAKILIAEDDEKIALTRHSLWRGCVPI